MLVLDVTVVNVALPRIDADLGFGPASLSWVLNAYTLAFGGLLLLGGRLGDVFGRLRIFELGLAIFTRRLAARRARPDPGQLVAARALQGVGAALAAPERTRPADHQRTRRGRAQPRARPVRRRLLRRRARSACCSAACVTDLGSWRWTLFINVPIGIVVLFLAPPLRRRDPAPPRPVRLRRRGHRDPRRGRRIVWSLIGAPEHGWTSARTIGGFAVGVALLAVLARTELRRRAPDDPAGAGAQPAAASAALLVMALVIGAQPVDVLPGRAVRPAGARLRAARRRGWRSCR